MTYAQLKELLDQLTPEQLSCIVTIYFWDNKKAQTAAFYTQDYRIETPMTYAQFRELCAQFTTEQLAYNVLFTTWHYEVSPASFFVNDGQIATLNEGHPVIRV